MVRLVGMICLLVFIAFSSSAVPKALESIVKYGVIVLLSFYLMLLPFLAMKGIYKEYPVRSTFGMVSLRVPT